MKVCHMDVHLKPQTHSENDKSYRRSSWKVKWHSNINVSIKVVFMMPNLRTECRIISVRIERRFELNSTLFCQFRLNRDQTKSQTPEKLLKPCQLGTHLRVLSEGYPINTNMTRFRPFSKVFASLFFGR